MLNMLITTLPGASVTYQGEELGMSDVWISWKDTVDPAACNSNSTIYEHFSRDPERTPFQWNSDVDAGFSNASKTWLPIAEDFKLVNVDQEQKASLSHLNIYKKLLQLRRETKTLQLGETEVKALSGAVLGVKRWVNCQLINLFTHRFSNFNSFLQHDFTYLTVMNLFDGTETVNLKDTFDNLTADMQVVLVSEKSQRKAG